MSPPADKGWVGGLSGVPYELRGDRDGLPALGWRSAPDLLALETEVGEFISAGGEHGVDEERRLAYVAVTRARRELLLTASVWADPTTPRITSRFLTELVDHPELGLRPQVWEPMPEPDGGSKPANPRQGEPVSATWPADPLAARRVRLSEAAQEVLGAMADLDLSHPESPPAESSPPEPLCVDSSCHQVLNRDPASPPDLPLVVGREREMAMLLAERESSGRPGDIEVRVPRHLSASAVVSLAGDSQAFARDVRRPMPAAPALAARRGTAFHAWVEQHYARAAFVDLLDLPGSADDNPCDDEELPRMKERFLASTWAARRPEAIEIAIETTVAGMAIRGRIDAVFRRPAGGFTVVDWKTGAKPSGDTLRARSLQLEAYRLAFARLRGVALDQVDAAFYYAVTGETVFPVMGQDDHLAAVLGSIPT
jgi:DNA helicase-2/ATP-dependent DNA helicase PcrA